MGTKRIYLKTFHKLAHVVHCFQIELEFGNVDFVGEENRRTLRETFEQRREAKENSTPYDARGPLLERFGNLSGPKPYFKIKILEIKKQVIAL